MIKDKLVRIRTRRDYPGQIKWSYVGKVVGFSENWIFIEGKGLIILKGQTRTVDIDTEVKAFGIPRDNITDIHILPDSFDLEKIELTHDGLKIGIRVPGCGDSWIGEAGD